MVLTKEQADKIQKTLLEVSMGGYLSEWNTNIKAEDICNELEEGIDKNVDIWEPLENFDPKLVADIISSHHRCVVSAVKEILAELHPEDDLTQLAGHY